MGFRDAFSKPGGFLNNVDGVLDSYQFTVGFQGGNGNGNGKKAKSDFTGIFFVPSITVDGATEAVETSIMAASAENFEVSADGQTLIPNDDRARLFGPIVQLLGSMIDNGLPEPEWAPGDPIDLTPLVGGRYRFVQVKDEASTKKLGKRKDKKTGKEYDRTNLEVAQVYSVGAAKAGKKVVPAVVKGKLESLAPTMVTVGNSDIFELAMTTLLDILAEAKENKIAKSKLSLAVTRKLQRHENREEVRKLIGSDEFLSKQDGWNYDASSRDQTIEAA